MAENDSQVAIPPRPVGEHVPSLVVLLDDKTKVSVPLTAQDNLLMSQVRVAQLREIMDKQLSLLKGKTKVLPALSIKALVDSFAKIEDMARFAYAPALNEEESGEKAGRAAAQMVKAMAEGITTASHKAVESAKDNKMKQIMELGKKPKMAEVEIVPEKTKEEVW